MDFFSQLFQSFVTLFVIMDPFASTPVFYSLTKNLNAQQKFDEARKAVLIAAIVFFFFIIGGPPLFGLLGISVSHFKVAGGIILFLIALQFVLGMTFPKEKKKISSEIVIIGVPMITGPGVLTASILLVNSVGFFITVFAGLISLLVTFLILLYSSKIMRLLGETGSEIFSRIMGLLLASIAVSYVLSGL